MCIFQSEQVIKLRNVLISLEIKRTATEFARSQTIGLSCGTRCWDAIRNIRQNRNVAELKTALLSNRWNDLPQEFTVH